MPCANKSDLPMLGCCGTPPVDDAFHIQGLANIGGWAELTEITCFDRYLNTYQFATRQANPASFQRYRELYIDSLTQVNLAQEQIHMRATIRYNPRSTIPIESMLFRREGSSDWVTVLQDPSIAHWPQAVGNHWEENALAGTLTASNITETSAAFTLVKDFGAPDGIVTISEVSVELRDPYNLSSECQSVVASFNSLQDWRHISYGGVIQGPEYILSDDGWILNEAFAETGIITTDVSFGNGSCVRIFKTPAAYGVRLRYEGGFHCNFGSSWQLIMQRCKRTFSRFPSIVCIDNSDNSGRPDVPRLIVESNLEFPAMLPELGATFPYDWMIYYPAVAGTAFGSPPAVPWFCRLAP